MPFKAVMIRGVATSARNLGWEPPHHPGVWDVVDAGKRISNGKKLFGSVQNLDHNGPASYHNDCSKLEYGFLTADWSQQDVGIAGHGIPNGHSGGVVGASLFDPKANRYSHNYGSDDGKSTKCVTDFALGGGYHEIKSAADNAYAINAHWWGDGNKYTNSWKAHALFVR